MTTKNHPWRGDQGRIPLVTAAAMVAVLLAGSIVMMLVDFLSFGFNAQWFASIGYGLSLDYLPMGVGVFVSLRYVAPIRVSNAVSSIVLRSLIALVGGAVLYFFVAFIWSFAQLPKQPLFGSSFPDLNLSAIVPNAFAGAVATFIQILPLAVLAGVFQWMWLARHPVAAERNTPASHG